MLGGREPGSTRKVTDSTDYQGSGEERRPARKHGGPSATPGGRDHPPGGHPSQLAEWGVYNSACVSSRQRGHQGPTPFTATGTVEDVVVPFPSSPVALLPQQSTPPLVSTAQ